MSILQDKFDFRLNFLTKVDYQLLFPENTENQPRLNKN